MLGEQGRLRPGPTGLRLSEQVVTVEDGSVESSKTKPGDNMERETSVATQPRDKIH